MSSGRRNPAKLSRYASSSSLDRSQLRRGASGAEIREIRPPTRSLKEALASSPGVAPSSTNRTSVGERSPTRTKMTRALAANSATPTKTASSNAVISVLNPYNPPNHEEPDRHADQGSVDHRPPNLSFDERVSVAWLHNTQGDKGDKRQRQEDGARHSALGGVDSYFLLQLNPGAQ